MDLNGRKGAGRTTWEMKMELVVCLNMKVEEAVNLLHFKKMDGRTVSEMKPNCSEQWI